MFQKVPPPIIRRLKLFTQHRVFVEIFLLLNAIVSELELTHDSGKKQKKGKGKSRFMVLFQHCGFRPIVFLPPNKFPHSSPERQRIIQMRETSTSEGGNYYQ